MCAQELGGKELLIADLAHFGESLWRNEEGGEKRFNFFVTLVIAVVSGLIALTTADDQLSRDCFLETTRIALFFLLLIGTMTYLRFLQRNRVTDEFKETLHVIRKTFKEKYAEDLVGYEVPAPLQPLAVGWLLLGGGYAETIGMINGFLLWGLLRVQNCSCPPGAAFWGFIFAFVQWIPPFLRRYRINRKDR